jgi:L-2-hydroxyglutarate oxidase LhgO
LAKQFSTTRFAFPSPDHQDIAGRTDFLDTQSPGLTSALAITDHVATLLS